VALAALVKVGTWSIVNVNAWVVLPEELVATSLIA